MVAAGVMFMAFAVIAFVVFVSCWVYDAVHDYDSAGARQIGFTALPLVVVFGFVSLMFFDAAHEEPEQDKTRVTIECVIANDDELTCEVAE